MTGRSGLIARMPAAMMLRSLVIAGARAACALGRPFVQTALAAACPVCAGPLGEHRGGVCISCWSEVIETQVARLERPVRHLRTLTALGPYEGRLRGIIRCLKFSDLPGLGPALGERLAPRLADLRDEIDVIVPVPLHRWRRWRRGYNQAALIAAGAARCLGRPMARRALVRRRATGSQTGRARRERMANVRGAFEAGRIRPMGRRILLIDDVVTTGATLRECARTLKAAGARTVHACAAARTLSRNDS